MTILRCRRSLRQAGGTNFHLYFNNTLQVVGFGVAFSGDVVKIIPFLPGIENISIVATVSGSVTENFKIVNGPLRVSWKNQLLGKINKTQIQITWSVATQLNNEKYIIEYSKDARNFSSIGEIAGDGTSNEIKHFDYIHTSPSIGMNYYLIKQVDYDGQYSYSNIATVRYNADSSINIYPNPTTSEVTVNVPSATTLLIINVYGKLFSQQDMSEGRNTINLVELPSGIPIFVVGDQRFKVLKE